VNKGLIIVLLMLQVLTAYSQNPDLHCTFFNKSTVDHVIITGVHGYKNPLFQIGIGSVVNKIKAPRGRKSNIATGPYLGSISASIEFSRDSGAIFIGPQISYWSNHIFAKVGLPFISYGANIIAYADARLDNARKGSLVFRPEIALVRKFKWLPFQGAYLALVYGYNFKLLNQNFSGINRHNFALKFYMKYR